MKRVICTMVVAVLIGCTSTMPVFPQTMLKGDVKIDGSSTVYLITEAMATNFKKQNPDVNFTVGVSGTGGGFKKFAAGELDINDASRPINPIESEKCKASGIEFTELQIGWDGIAVVIHPQNVWAKNLTLEQLKKIWHPNIDGFKNAEYWSDVDPAFPKIKLDLYGPGPDSGTSDFFTGAVNGKEKLVRNDFTASEDDNVLVEGVARNKGAMGYFGVAYFESNRKALAAVAVAKKAGEIHYLPETKDVLSRKYPLSRPLFLYVRNSSLKNPAVAGFLEFYLRRGDLVRDAKYIELTPRQRVEVQEKFEAVLKNKR